MYGVFEMQNASFSMNDMVQIDTFGRFTFSRLHMIPTEVAVWTTVALVIAHRGGGRLPRWLRWAWWRNRHCPCATDSSAVLWLFRLARPATATTRPRRRRPANTGRHGLVHETADAYSLASMPTSTSTRLFGGESVPSSWFHRGFVVKGPDYRTSVVVAVFL